MHRRDLKSMPHESIGCFYQPKGVHFLTAQGFLEPAHQLNEVCQIPLLQTGPVDASELGVDICG